MKDAVTPDALPAETPSAIRRLLTRCLERNVRRRLQSMGEARIVIEDVLSGTNGETAPVASSAHVPVRRPWWARAGVPAASALVVALVVGAGAWALRPAPVLPVMSRFAVVLPEGVSFTSTASQAVAISPDGLQVAFTANNRPYDLLPDGRIVGLVPGADANSTPTNELRVVLNWYDELKRLVPTK